MSLKTGLKIRTLRLTSKIHVLIKRKALVLIRGKELDEVPSMIVIDQKYLRHKNNQNSEGKTDSTSVEAYICIFRTEWRKQKASVVFIDFSTGGAGVVVIPAPTNLHCHFVFVTVANSFYFCNHRPSFPNFLLRVC